MEVFKEQNRIKYIDLAKGFCILLVILTHAKESFLVHSSFDYAMASFRMPLYFLLSGLFFKEYSGFFEFIIKKTNKLLIPFLFFYIVIALCFPLLMELLNSGFIKNAGMSYLFCIYNENFNGMPMGIWFLWCLFIVNILFYIILLVSKMFKSYILLLIFSSLFIGFLGCYLGIKRINIPLYLDSAMTSLPFFCAGYILRKFTNILHPNKFDKYILFISLFIFVSVFFLAYESASFRKNIFNVDILSLYLCGLLGALGVIFISKKIKSLPFVSFMGRYSIMVLCSHQIILMAIKVLLEYFRCNGWSAVIISFILTCGMSYLLIFPMKKYMSYVTAQKDLIK